jgi:hypothetical protein
MQFGINYLLSHWGSRMGIAHIMSFALSTLNLSIDHYESNYFICLLLIKRPTYGIYLLFIEIKFY